LHLSSASIIGSLTAIHDQETDLLIPSLWLCVVAAARLR
jgi:hypothetical protein